MDPFPISLSSEGSLVENMLCPMDRKSPKPVLALARLWEASERLACLLFARFSSLALEGCTPGSSLLLLSVKCCKTQALISQSKVCLLLGLGL